MASINSSRLVASVILALLTCGLLYLLLWPVGIEPAAWDAPANPGLVDPFAANDRLRKARAIDLGEHSGPEDVAGGPDGYLYASTDAGTIIRFRPQGRDLSVFSEPGGRPLGLEFDLRGNLLVANSHFGLQMIRPDGSVTTLLSEVAGRKIVAANDLAVAADGKIYFTESSSKFGTERPGSTYQASRLDILEHGGHGRVFEFDPASGEVRTLMQGLNYANGVAISSDQQFLLVVETAHYRVWRYWLRGAKAGDRELILQNLPGFPDNINNGLNERFWIGLIAPRNSLLDAVSEFPIARKMILRLPRAMQPDAVPSSHVIAVNGDGQVLMNLQDRSASFPSLTGVYETRRYLFLSSLFGNRIGRLDKNDLVSRL